MNLENKFNMVDEIDVDSLMEAVDKADSSEDTSTLLVGERLYGRDMQDYQATPVNKPSWNGRINAICQKTSDQSDDEELFRCGR